MESFGDKARAVVYSLLLHGVLLLFIVAGLWWTRESKPIVMPGPIIEATLVGPTAAPKPTARSPKPTQTPPKLVEKPAEKPVVEQAKPEPPKPAEPEKAAEPPPPPKQDLVEQQRIAALAEQKAADAKKEQEAKRRREQILLEQEKKAEEERKAEAKRQKELEDVRKQLAAAEKKKNLERERLKQLQDRNLAAQEKAERDRMSELLAQEAKEAMTGANGQDNDLRARYAAAIQAAVTQNWNRPESVPAGLRCTLRIVQIPGGDVISANVVAPCNADQAARNSIEQAVMRAAPLPYQGYEKVFSREINFNFKYDGQG
jgi:colicin import membrane protein